MIVLFLNFQFTFFFYLCLIPQNAYAGTACVQKQIVVQLYPWLNKILTKLIFEFANSPRKVF